MDAFDGFTDFMRANNAALSRFAYLVAGNHADAQDLMQAALTRTAVRWQRVARYDDPTAYVRRVMVNESISWWRRRRRLRIDPADVPPERARSDTAPDTESRIILWAALDQLTVRQRSVLVLRFYEDLSDGRYLLRDLTGVRTVPTDTRRPVGWSADSRWMALADARSEDGVEIVAPPGLDGVPMPLPDGETRPLAGVTSDGAAVFGPTEAHEIGAPGNVRFTDRQGITRTVRTQIRDDIAATQVAPDGTVLVQVMQVRNRNGTPADVLRVDPDDGTVLGRLRLPEPDAVVQTGPTVDGEHTQTVGGEHRSLSGMLGDRALLTHWTGDRITNLELLDLTTGDRHIVTRPGTDLSWLAIRGQPQ